MKGYDRQALFQSLNYYDRIVTVRSYCISAAMLVLRFEFKRTSSMMSRSCLSLRLINFATWESVLNRTHLNCRHHIRVQIGRRELKRENPVLSVGRHFSNVVI